MPCDGRDIQWFGDACGCVDGAPGGLAGVSGGCSAFFSRGVLSGIVTPCGCLRRQVLCVAFQEALRVLCAHWVVCVVKTSERCVQGGFRWRLGSTLLRGFCGGAILLLLWLCPWLVARLQGRVFLSSGL